MEDRGKRAWVTGAGDAVEDMRVEKEAIKAATCSQADSPESRDLKRRNQ